MSPSRDFRTLMDSRTLSNVGLSIVNREKVIFFAESNVFFWNLFFFMNVSNVSTLNIPFCRLLRHISLADRSYHDMDPGLFQ